jgi:hypothetical protein
MGEGVVHFSLRVLPRPTLPLTVDAMQITVGELVKTGFRYLGPKDAVECPYCTIRLRNWQAEDKAIEEHRTHSPNCPMLLYYDKIQADNTAGGYGFTRLTLTAEEYGIFWPFLF